MDTLGIRSGGKTREGNWGFRQGESFKLWDLPDSRWRPLCVKAFDSLALLHSRKAAKKGRNVDPNALNLASVKKLTPG